MAVVWIINQYGGIPSAGISGRHYQFCTRLSKCGHKVYLFSASYHHHLNVRATTCIKPKLERVDKDFFMVWLKTFRYKSSNSFGRFANWLVFAFNMLFGRPKDICKPDIIVYSSLSPIGALSAELLAKLYKVPFVFEVRDLWPLTLQEIKSISRYNPISVALQIIQDRAYRKADLVISSLPGIGDHINSRNIVGKEFLWLPNGSSSPDDTKINAEDFSVLNSLDRDSFTVGYAGSFGHANHIDVLLEASKYLLKRPNIKIVLIGAGALLEDYKQYILDHSLTNVEIYGRMSRNAVLEAYKMFDVCYIGWGDYKMYDYGTSANKMSEYMSAGKPILNRYSGRYDFVKENGCGLSVCSNSAREVADAIIKFDTMTASELETMSENSLKFAKNTFDYDEISKKFEAGLCKEIHSFNLGAD